MAREGVEVREHYLAQLRWIAEHPEDCPVDSIRVIATDLLTSFDLIHEWKQKVADLEARATKPRARNTDPDTSHRAAKKVKHNITERRRAAFQALQAMGPATDLGLWFYYQTHRGSKGWPQQSESGLRTRRAELVRLGKIQQSGVSEITNRKRIVWETAVADLV